MTGEIAACRWQLPTIESQLSDGADRVGSRLESSANSRRAICRRRRHRDRRLWAAVPHDKMLRLPVKIVHPTPFGCMCLQPIAMSTG